MARGKNFLQNYRTRKDRSEHVSDAISRLLINVILAVRVRVARVIAGRLVGANRTLRSRRTSTRCTCWQRRRTHRPRHTSTSCTTWGFFFLPLALVLPPPLFDPAPPCHAFWKAPTVGYSLGHRTSKASAYGPPSTLTFIFLWPPPCPWAISDVWLGNRELGLGRTRHEERAT